MQYINILECNGALGTCCSDFGIVQLINGFRTFLDGIQILGPIILIIMSVVQLLFMLINPDDKKLTQSLKNKFIATAVLFLLPTIVMILLNALSVALPNSTFEFADCWKNAKANYEITVKTPTKYVPKGKQREKINFITGPKFDQGSSGRAIGSGSSSDVVNYARKFLGKHYIFGGAWNGEEPYTGTDCSGFVGGVYRHFGVTLPRTTYDMYAQRNSLFTDVTNSQHKAGDIVLYEGHVGMLTGNGDEMIHAANESLGITTTPTYKYTDILGVYRVK